MDLALHASALQSRLKLLVAAHFDLKMLLQSESLTSTIPPDSRRWMMGPMQGLNLYKLALESVRRLGVYCSPSRLLLEF